MASSSSSSRPLPAKPSSPRPTSTQPPMPFTLTLPMTASSGVTVTASFALNDPASSLPSDEPLQAGPSANSSKADTGIAAYHTSLSSHLRYKLASHLRPYIPGPSASAPYPPQAECSSSSSSSSAAAKIPAIPTQLLNPPRSKMYTDLSALAARDKEHSRAWILEGHKRYTTGLKEGEFQLDAGSVGLGIRKRRRRNTEDPMRMDLVEERLRAGVLEGLEGMDAEMVLDVAGSAVERSDYEGLDRLDEEEEGDGQPDRKRPRMGRAETSGTLAAAAMRRTVSADPPAGSRTPMREREGSGELGVEPLGRSIQHALTALDTTPLLMNTDASASTTVFESFIQTPPPSNFSNRPGSSAATGWRHPSTDGLRGFTPVSPRSQDKLPAMTRPAAPSRHASHLLPKQPIVSGPSTTSGSSSIASLTSASLSCSHAELSPQIPVGLPMMSIAQMGDFVQAVDAAASGKQQGKRAEGVPAEGMDASDEATLKAKQAKEQQQVLVTPHERALGGAADDDFWAELSDRATPM